MEIKLNMLRVNIIFYFLVFLVFHGDARAEDLSESNKIVIGNLENQTDIMDFNSKNPLQDVVLDLSVVVNNSSNIKKTTEFIELPNNILDLASKNEFILSTDEYIQIRGVDNRKLLADGSILIQFKVFPNLENYALSNDIELVSNLSDINIGVFKIKNILELKLKIDSLRSDNNIINIDLNTIDPALTAK